MREPATILYMASTGCQWRAMPKEFPPYSTVQGYFYAWSHGGLLADINHMLVRTMRAKAGRPASPTAGSQSVKTTESGGPRASMPARKSKAASVVSSPSAALAFDYCAFVRGGRKHATVSSMHWVEPCQ